MQFSSSSSQSRSWYVMDEAVGNRQSAPRGPYTRTEILQFFVDGYFSNGALLYTRDRIFPNPAKPNSSRKVCIQEYRRWDQIPDPVRRQLEAEAALMKPSKKNAVAAPHESVGFGEPTFDQPFRGPSASVGPGRTAYEQSFTSPSSSVGFGNPVSRNHPAF